MTELAIMDIKERLNTIPTTRYQGSKRKLLPWIYDAIKDIEFHTILDAFGGSASVSMLLKMMGKAVTFNDILKFNSIIGESVIANSQTTLSDSDVAFLLDFTNINGVKKRFIEDTFKGIYYLDSENVWLDNIMCRISELQLLYRGETLKYKQAIAYNALFQSCLIKRPYNLFHRKNLDMRTRQVDRSFGNKITWDTPFAQHFVKFVKEINRAVFDSGTTCYAVNCDILEINQTFDAVYIDPPYIKKTGTVDYLNYYHFLEGLVNYDSWNDMIDLTSSNKRMMYPFQNQFRPYCGLQTLENIICKFHDSKLIVSYKDGGIPSIDELVGVIQQYKRRVVVHKTSYKYALSKNNSGSNSCEYIIVGE